MPDSSLPVIKAVIATLKANGLLAGLVGGRVFTDVPQASPFPYCVISTSSVPFAGQDFSGQRHTLRVQSFSREPSMQQCLRMQSAVVNALDRQEAALGAVDQLVICQFSMTDRPFLEDDGKTWQAVTEFELVIG